MVDQELELLEDFERDSSWFHEHINSIRAKGFTGKFVAIKNSELIASGERVDEVMKELDEKGEKASYIFIEFVHPAGFTLIL